MQDNTTNTTVVAKEFDNSTLEAFDNITTLDADNLKLTREIRVSDNPVPNTCSSSVDLLRGHPRSTRGIATPVKQRELQSNLYFAMHTQRNLFHVAFK